MTKYCNCIFWVVQPVFDHTCSRMELLIAAATALTLAAQAPKSSTIEVTYEGISDLGQQDFAIAAETWERCLISDAPIHIRK